MRFEDFVLQLDSSARGGFRARVLKSPFGEGTAAFSLSSLAGEEAAPRDTPGTPPDGAQRGAGPSSTFGGLPPVKMGAELYHAIFQGQVRTLLDKSRGRLETSPQLGLRFKIKLDPSDEEVGSLADLPWELLCDETEDFLALSRQTSIVRYLDVPRASHPIAVAPPLRILAVGASPRGLQPLNLDEEMGRFTELSRASAEVEVQSLPHASIGAVREALSGDAYNVLHFMGHGMFDRESGQGMLAFEAPNGSLDLVSGRAFATKLRDLRSLGVVSLNACDTARASHQSGANPFQGVATALVLGGVPAVVAMQRPISDRGAIRFSTAFYQHLARGVSIDEALTEGRQAIHSAKPNSFEWATPVLFLRMPEGNVFVTRQAAEAEEKTPGRPVQSPPVAAPPRRGETVRRGRALKIAAGTAGVALLSAAVYTQLRAPAREPSPPAHVENAAAPGLAQSKPPKPESQAEPKAAPASPRPSGRGGERAASVSTAHEPTARRAARPDAVPTPVEPRRSGGDEVSAATADLSGLTVQLVAIERREEGGLRLTLGCKNAADHPLAAILDTEDSVLTDDQGQRYSILDSDLPSSGSSPRLALAAGASSSHTLDFPAPKLGSRRFYLALLAEGGRRIRVAGSPVALAASP